MAAPALTARVRDVVGPVAVAAGLYLEDVEVHRVGARTTVRIVLDLDEDQEGALALDEIAEVSHAISAALDQLSELDEEYTLEVSSPGTSRPLTEPRHFLRARGRLVHLVLTDGSELVGRLTDVVEGLATVLPEPVAAKKGGPLKARPAVDIPLADITHGQVEVELAHAMTVDLGADDGDDDELHDGHHDEDED